MPRGAGAVPAGDGAGVGGEGVGTGEALVGVQVESDVAAPREGDEAFEIGDRVVGEVRGPADQVDARVEGGLEDRVGHGRPAERDELDVHEAREFVSQADEGADSGQRVFSAQQVDVGADGGDPGCQHPQRRGTRTVERVLLVERHREGVPALDRALEVAERRPDGIPGLRLVEVRVGFGARRGDDVAGEVERLAVRRAAGAGQRRAGRDHRDDGVAVDRDVHERAGGQSRVVDRGDRDGWSGGHEDLRRVRGRMPRHRGVPSGAAFQCWCDQHLRCFRC
ncbi:hypothetical protein SRABI128_00113 [Microbacterium sp. Bi128]|nr:hypothetical protein SRABI128_00113 [Microbacterium sp. Bi128]